MTEKNTVPNLEAKASDGNPIFTPRQWLERFRQFAKREHKIDIAPLIKGEDITEWSGKEQLIHEVFIWGVGPEALYQITRRLGKSTINLLLKLDVCELMSRSSCS